MRLARYFARYTAGTIALVLVGLVVLVVAVTLIESADDLVDIDAGALTALRLGLFGAVQHGYQVMPISCLLGTLLTGTLLARRGELLAAQAAGISGRRLVTPFLVVVVCAAGLGSACGELWVPAAVAGAERVHREELRHVSALTRFYNRRLEWFREGDLLLHLPTVNRETQTFDHPTAYRFENGLISQVIEGEQLYHDRDGWWLAHAKARSAEMAEIETHERLSLGLTVDPEDLIDVTGDPRQLTSREVRQLITRRRKAGFDATAHRIELQNRLAMPLSAIWMFLLVSPWILHPDRRRSIAVTLGAGVVTIAVLLSVTHVFRLMALGHKIPVEWGAWGPGVFSIVAFPLSWAVYQRYRISGSIWPSFRIRRRSG